LDRIVEFIRCLISFQAWLATAVDTNRVSGAIPIVMDALNLRTVSSIALMKSFFL